MYLLMLLATFISAIYGYNLSARPDYDRDLAKKKAVSVVYRFTLQDQAVADLLNRITNGVYAETSYGIRWVLPNDIVYADYDNADVKNSTNQYTTLFLKQNGTVDMFHLRKYKNYHTHTENVHKGVTAENMMETGRRLYDGKMMMSKVLCLTQKMQISDAESCTPSYVDPTSPSSGVTGTCCGHGNDYLVTYQQIDPRWLNRITLGVNLDFMRALMNKGYSDSIGIITWDGSHWQFRGKTNFEAAYAAQEQKYYEEMSKNNENVPNFPDSMKNVSEWELPNYIFDRNFFKDKSGQNMCEHGCLFHIRYL